MQLLCAPARTECAAQAAGKVTIDEGKAWGEGGEVKAWGEGGEVKAWGEGGEVKAWGEGGEVKAPVDGARTRSKSDRWEGGAALTACTRARTHASAASGRTVRKEPVGAGGGMSSSSSELVFSACRSRRVHADMAAVRHDGLMAMHAAAAAEVSAESLRECVSTRVSSAT